MGGGNDHVKTELPQWAQGTAQALLRSAVGSIAPNDPTVKQGVYGLTPFDPSLYQQVAPFTQDQYAGMDTVRNAAGQSGALAGSGYGQLQQTLGGAYLSPDSDPYLQQSYDAATKALVNKYRDATAPSIMSQAQQAGMGNSTALGEQLAASRYGLGQNLEDLAASIYGGNYQQERSRQLQAAGMIPQAQQSLMQPGTSLLGLGAYQQGQQQTELDTARANAELRTEWPYKLLSFLGGALGQATGGGGVTTYPGK